MTKTHILLRFCVFEHCRYLFISPKSMKKKKVKKYLQKRVIKFMKSFNFRRFTSINSFNTTVLIFSNSKRYNINNYSLYTHFFSIFCLFFFSSPSFPTHFYSFSHRFPSISNNPNTPKPFKIYQLGYLF